MMQTENYKQRAVDVRRTARASLLEIRQARLAKRAELSVGQSAAATTSDVRLDAATASFDPPVPDHEPCQFDPEPSSAAEAASPAMADATSETEPDVQIDDLDALAAKNASLAENAEPSGSDNSGALQPVLPVQPDDETVRVQEDRTPSDLADLPGAGPGLVWMLAQCNILTLAQLAEQDADNLASQLGVIGQIIDVRQWITFAQEHG
ncbi:MAG: hypothetical protein AAFP85_05900 [Pseudomonadota bacterium]